MSEYITRVTRLSVMLKGDPIYANSVTHIEIEDEAGGEFVVVKQQDDLIEPGEIRIALDEWEAIKAAVEQLLPETKQ